MGESMNKADFAIAVLLAFMPISEVRGAIPFVLYKSNDTVAVTVGIVLSIVSNMIVPFAAYFVLDLLDKLVKSKYSPLLLKRIYSKILNLGVKRSLKMKKISYFALALFVGIPLPATGAWTGTLVAYVLGLDRRKSIIAIEVGVLMASLIVLIVAYTGIEILAKIFLS
jgi:uncharacterized membrane protein